jgi:hypothetical protein
MANPPDPASTPGAAPASPGATEAAPTTPLHNVLSGAQVNLQAALAALSGASPEELETLRSANLEALRAADQVQNHYNNPPPPPPPPPSDPPNGGGSGCGGERIE